MNYRFMDDLLRCSDEELQEINNKITEQLNVRKELKKKKAFDNFMKALEVMAGNCSYETFKISNGGDYICLDWDDLYKSFLEMM